MVKRLGLVIALLLVCSSAFAECVINTDTCFWTDADRFMAIGQVIAIAGVETAQASNMMMQDLKDGVAIILSKGTKVNVVERPNKWVIVINLGATPLCGLSQFVSCK